MKYYFIEFIGKAGSYFKKADVVEGQSIADRLLAHYGSSLSPWVLSKVKDEDFKVTPVTEQEFQAQLKWEW